MSFCGKTFRSSKKAICSVGWCGSRPPKLRALGLTINQSKCKAWWPPDHLGHLPPQLHEHRKDILCDGLVICGLATRGEDGLALVVGSSASLEALLRKSSATHGRAGATETAADTLPARSTCVRRARAPSLASRPIWCLSMCDGNC